MAVTTEATGASVDSAFIRRAVELADLNAVRTTLYMHTHDPEIAALPPTIRLTDEQRTLLIDKAAAWLEENAGPAVVEEPEADELRKLMVLATGNDMDDLEYEARRQLPAFKDFPFFAQWPGGKKPELPEGFNVVIIGSGFSGIASAVQMEILGIPYTVLEKEHEPGGTWSINRYPDVRVDTISITYEFSFEKEHRWSEYFGRGPEVRAYLLKVAKKFGAYDNMKFGHKVSKATFDEARNVWEIEADTPDGKAHFTANFVVNCVGTFTNAKLPQFEGQENFKGLLVHPNRYPADLDLTGKKVAVIGNGSTGVQLLKPVAEVAESVAVFQRTPQWISPRDKYGSPVEPEVAWLIDNFPGYWNWWRYMAIAGLFGTHGFLKQDDEWVANGGKFNPMSDQLRSDLTAYIKAQVNGDQKLIDQLVPDYAPFSRRPVVDNGWYKSLTRDNVELVTDKIVRLTETGIETSDGVTRDVDVIITAVGFEIAQYLFPIDYRGKNGVSIFDYWAKDGARAYLSMMVPEFPNMIMLYGPNSQPLSGGTGLPIWYVIWVAYGSQLMMRMFEEGKTRVEVKTEAYQRYNEALDIEASQLLLLQEEGAPEKNYYVNEFGRLQMNAPWYGPEFHRLCTVIDWNDLEIS
jgi:4-hydroxyacetophenone monooxygenase